MKLLSTSPRQFLMFKSGSHELITIWKFYEKTQNDMKTVWNEKNFFQEDKNLIDLIWTSTDSLLGLFPRTHLMDFVRSWHSPRALWTFLHRTYRPKVNTRRKTFFNLIFVFLVIVQIFRYHDEAVYFVMKSVCELSLPCRWWKTILDSSIWRMLRAIHIEQCQLGNVILVTCS